MKSSEVLVMAKKLIEKSENWTQGAYARNSINRVVASFDPAACKFCSLGAINKITGVHKTSLAPQYLQKIVGEFVGSWNDRSNHSEVLAVFDKAIELAKKEGN